jgi:hypothetical protein
MAIQHGAWFLASDAPLPVCRQRDLRVIVMTMDRQASLERLLHSLRSAAYQPGTSVDLRVTVDRRPGQPHDAPTLSFLAQFDWPHGYFEVHAWPEPVGIYGQWVDSWPCEQFPSNLYKAAVLLEDDLEVSPVYHEWFIGAHQAYASPDLGAVTGMRAQLVAQIGVAQSIEQLIPKGLQVFAYRLIATWSMSPTHDAWRRFRAWVKTAKADPGYDPAVDGTHPGEWYRGFKASGNEAGMWEIWFLRFMHDQNLYTLYPWIEDGARTVVCNWREAGLHFNGDDSSQCDYPLVASLPTTLLSQALVQYVDWGLAFYHCLDGDLYGGTSNQILTLAWANKMARNQRKLLRIVRKEGMDHYLLDHWDEIFDSDAFPYFLRDGTKDERCATFSTFEATYLEMLNVRGEGLTLPMPRKELQEKVEAYPSIGVSVHGRSLEGNCEIVPFICIQEADETQVQNICDYSYEKLSSLFWPMEKNKQVVLFTDRQNPALDQTYAHVDSRPLFEQLWAMVLSETHVGNPKSSLDFMISMWRKQLGRLNGMEPAACYQARGSYEVKSRQHDSVEVLNLHFVWVNPYLSPTSNNVKEEEALNVAKSWGVLPNSKMFFWTGQEIRNEFPDLVPVLEQIPVAAWISDIVRYNVVNKFGGLYLDTDELFLQDPRPLMKQNQNHFTVCQTPWLVPKTQTNEPCESVGCAVIAAPAGHPAVACAAQTSVQKSLAALEKQKGSTPVFDSAYSGPPMWTQCVKEHNMNIIPSWNFYPCPCCEDCKLTQYQDMEGIYGMHKWEHSWW